MPTASPDLGEPLLQTAVLDDSRHKRHAVSLLGLIIVVSFAALQCSGMGMGPGTTKPSITMASAMERNYLHEVGHNSTKANATGIKAKLAYLSNLAKLAKECAHGSAQSDCEGLKTRSQSGFGALLWPLMFVGYLFVIVQIFHLVGATPQWFDRLLVFAGRRAKEKRMSLAKVVMARWAQVHQRSKVEILQLRMSLAECIRQKEVPECPICFEKSLFWIRGRCGHGACRQCVKSHLRVNCTELMQSMKTARKFNVTCFLPDCDELLNPSLVAVFAPEMAALVDNVRTREKFIAKNPKGWVECPNMACVGVGYRGQRHIMCFVCEEKWEDPHYNTLNRAVDWVKSLFVRRMPRDAKPCPHCGVAIIKNGGCPQMFCELCKKSFTWSEGALLMNSGDPGV
jgi:hypothetical protein